MGSSLHAGICLLISNYFGPVWEEQLVERQNKKLCTATATQREPASHTVYYHTIIGYSSPWCQMLQPCSGSVLRAFIVECVHISMTFADLRGGACKGATTGTVRSGTQLNSAVKVHT